MRGSWSELLQFDFSLQKLRRVTIRLLVSLTRFVKHFEKLNRKIISSLKSILPSQDEEVRFFFPNCKLLSKDLRNSPFQFLSNKFFSEKLKSLFLYRQNWFIQEKFQLNQFLEELVIRHQSFKTYLTFNWKLNLVDGTK